MSDQSSSPLEDMNVDEIGAVFESGSQQQMARPQQGGEQAPKPSAPQIQSLDFILDIPLKVTVELGRSKMAIREILQLAQGSVVELSKFAGEPLEVLVNEKLIARGEVVVVNEKFGIRLTDIISPVERIEQLK